MRTVGDTILEGMGVILSMTASLIVFILALVFLFSVMMTCDAVICSIGEMRDESKCSTICAGKPDVVACFNDCKERLK